MALKSTGTNGCETNEEAAPTKEELSMLESFRKFNLDEKYIRFEVFMAKYKESMLVALEGVGGSIWSVTTRSMAAESCTLDPLRKRIPSSLKIGRSKTMYVRAFGLEVVELSRRNEVLVVNRIIKNFFNCRYLYDVTNCVIVHNPSNSIPFANFS